MAQELSYFIMYRDVLDHPRGMEKVLEQIRLLAGAPPTDVDIVSAVPDNHLANHVQNEDNQDLIEDQDEESALADGAMEVEEAGADDLMELFNVQLGLPDNEAMSIGEDGGGEGEGNNENVNIGNLQQ